MKLVKIFLLSNLYSTLLSGIALVILVLLGIKPNQTMAFFIGFTSSFPIWAVYTNKAINDYRKEKNGNTE